MNAADARRLIDGAIADNAFRSARSRTLGHSVLDALRAAAGGADRVVLCWDGDQCTLHALEASNFYGLFRLTDVAVSSPEEDR